MFVTGSEDGSVIVWKRLGQNWETHYVQILDRDQKKYRANAAVWNNDDTRLCILGNDGKIQIWDSDGKNYIETFDGQHHKNSFFIQAHPKNANLIFSVGFEGVLRTWNLMNFECTVTLLNLKEESKTNFGFDATVSSDGEKIVVGGKKFLKIFSAASN